MEITSFSNHFTKNVQRITANIRSELKSLPIKERTQNLTAPLKEKVNYYLGEKLKVPYLNGTTKIYKDSGRVLNFDTFINELDPITGNGKLLVERSNPHLPPIKALIPDIHGGLDIIQKYLQEAHLLDQNNNVKEGARVIFLGDVIGTRIPKIDSKSYTDKSSIKLMRYALQNDMDTLNWVLKQVELGRAKCLAGNYEIGVLTNIHNFIKHPVSVTGVPYVKGYKQYVMGNFEKFGKLVDEKPIIDLYHKIKDAILSGKIVAAHYEDGIFSSHSLVSPRFADLLLKRQEIKTVQPKEISDFLNRELIRSVLTNDFSHPMFKPTHFDYSRSVPYNFVANRFENTFNHQPVKFSFPGAMQKTTFKIPLLVDFGGPLNASPEEFNIHVPWNKLPHHVDLPKLDFVQAIGHKMTSSFMQHLDLYINPLKNARITKYENPYIKLIGLDVGTGYPRRFFAANYHTGYTTLLTDSRGKGLLFIESSPYTTSS